VNADLLAAQIEDTAGIKAGKRAIQLVRQSIFKGIDFALESTLSGVSHRKLIALAKENEYEVILIYIWLDRLETAIERVIDRVDLGGHNIPENVIQRRYKRGLINLFSIYTWICDYWAIIDNSNQPKKIVAEGSNGLDFRVLCPDIWIKMKSKYNEFKNEL
jgi:predicted ABC-type ATPase